jgi:D-alanyl-D-alanine carboxypeptidase
LYATSFEEITEACGTYRYYCKSEEGVAKGWLNSNPLLNENGQYYCSLVTGLKTGSTDEAGKCLATMAEKNGEKIIIVVLSAPDVDMRNSDTLEIIYAELG